MPTLRLALVFAVTLLVAGCTMPRDADDDKPTMDDDPAMDDTRDIETTGGGPMMAAHLFGTWDFTATEIDGDRELSGALTVSEEPGGGWVSFDDDSQTPLEIGELEMTNANFVMDATVRGSEPQALRLVGSVDGDEMTAEAEVEGMGSFALTATRRMP